ncbi:DUF4386 domain-containing protein [Lysobacter sp. M15]|uniref:DUF4386 domain-containing protein n=1 Tax=Lysobacter sp. M15 TaxID=2916837 RepID=UPI001F56E471|nr:DUF4386 domain-containing protein [Lysobacter sp. M15]
MTITSPEADQIRAARLAGAMYLITMGTGIFGQSFVRGSLLVRGDATQTALNIIESERLFRVGIATDLITFTGVVVLIWALYVLLRPAGKNLALLAVLFRLVEVAVHYVAVLFSLSALVLLSGADYLAPLGEDQLHALARVSLNTQGAGLNLGFVLLGLGSAAFAYLFLRSRYVPKILAGWGVFASLLLSASAIAVILFPAVGRFVLAAMVPMFIYEVTLGFWLLLKGAKIRPDSTSAA